MSNVPNVPEIPEAIEIGQMFGYTTIADPEVIYREMHGPDMPRLRQDMIVRVKGDSRGYVSGSASTGERAVIIGFRCSTWEIPGGSTDHIVGVATQAGVTWLKPSEIELASATDA